MRKFWLGVVLAALIITAVGAVYFFAPIPVNVNSSPAEMTFKYGDENIHATLSDEDADAIRTMLSGKTTYYDSSSCGFDEHICVRFGTQTFMPACDGCPTVKYGTKYIALSDSERASLDEILTRYGAHFPCV